MTAAELRDLAKNSPGNNKQYLRIIDGAKKAALQGKFMFWFYEIVSDQVRSKLQSDGISSENVYDRDGNMCKISWEP